MLYMISIILLFLLLILMPKTKEKLNIIKTMLLTFLEILAYNTLLFNVYKHSNYINKSFNY